MQRRGLRPTFSRARGFTLVELLVVLSVFAILLGLAAPSFMSIIANNRVASAANDIITVLNLGKSEAVRSGQTVVLCKRASDSACDTDASTDWSNGWILFVDSVSNNQIDDGERIVRLQPATEESLDVAYKGNDNKAINFNPNGRTGATGHFCLRNTHDDNKSRAVVVNIAARFHIEEQPYDCN
ncbi:hypothetical protein Tel_07665 [Candidatus Tenderia electrophaga]|jgi:type IV fimbrial biogenesis protein FimT|uniref:Type II secretion system protein H n=1 Tax=Candidatus Tenderia electrophaga TaxID=1748243 RepID=A0A0S2TD37_9GAMM|nr:hypothetical protein Tel_07665 [Candidatus Tenderia electrophaga]